MTKKEGKNFACFCCVLKNKLSWRNTTHSHTYKMVGANSATTPTPPPAQPIQAAVQAALNPSRTPQYSVQEVPVGRFQEPPSVSNEAKPPRKREKDDDCSIQ